jgi:hypothetical protein
VGRVQRRAEEGQARCREVQRRSAVPWPDVIKRRSPVDSPAMVGMQDQGCSPGVSVLLDGYDVGA